MTFTRVSGQDVPLSYELRWLGNDGTFQIRPALSLPLNTPVDVPLTIAPVTAGVHSAIVQVVDPDRSLIIHQAAVTIVAAEEFRASENFTISRAGQAPRPERVSHFFAVPDHVPILSVAVRVGSGSLRSTVYDPSGRSVDSYVANSFSSYQPAGTDERRAFENPRAGVWEVVVENAQDASRVDRSFPDPVPPSDYTLTARLLGADVSPLVQRASPQADTPLAFVARNRLGSFTGALKGTALGTARTDRPTLTREAPWHIVEITVPPGTERLVAETNSASDLGADLDLYLFDCTGKRCTLQAFGTNSTSTERVSVNAPAAGIWKVVLDAFALSGDSTSVDYRDVLLHPLYGRLEVADAPTPRTPDAIWHATVVPRVDAKPQIDRSLVGYIEVIGTDVEEPIRGPKGIVKSPVVLGRALISLDERNTQVERRH